MVFENKHLISDEVTFRIDRTKYERYLYKKTAMDLKEKIKSENIIITHHRLQLPFFQKSQQVPQQFRFKNFLSKCWGNVHKAGY